VGPGQVTPFEQVNVVPSSVHVVFGKPFRSTQLGPVHVYCKEKAWPGPQEVTVPLADVIFSLGLNLNFCRKWKVEIELIFGETRILI
jgi:hypothetical protein